MSTCSHKWSMANLRHGYLVVEGCYKCKARCSFFSSEAASVDGSFWERPCENAADASNCLTFLSLGMEAVRRGERLG